MANSARGVWGFIAAGLLVAAAAGGYLAYRAARGTAGSYEYAATTAPVTQPATSESPQTKPAPPKPRPTTTFIDVIRAGHPHYAATRPLAFPVRDLAEGARIILRDPVYLATGRADLWITRRDGLPTPDALRRAIDRSEYPQVHVLPERVRFVHWNPDEPAWVPFVVCERSDGGFDVVSLKRRQPIEAKRTYEWDRAMSWGQKVVVPSEAGVSVFSFEPKLTEDYRALLDPKDAQGRPPEARPQALIDFQGLIAWAPAESGRVGSRGAARYVDDKWVDLGPAQGWPEQILHLVPLKDGSVLQIIAAPEGAVKLALTTLYVADVSEAAIAALVEQMSDVEAEKREAAHKQLSQYGPGVYPLLEKLAEDQPPEARTRLRALMRNQVRPTLGGMSLMGDKLVTVTRQNDGAALFYAEGGVAIPVEDSSEPVRRAPAWLSIRPGAAAEVLDAALVGELKPDESELYFVASEWVATGDAAGPRRWMGSEFVPLLRKTESAFSEFVGIDRRGRWLLRKPAGDETLVIDPSLPDPIPRLPFWELVNARAQGWDAQGWPVVRRDGGDWALLNDRWKLLNAKKGEQMLTELPASRPSTIPSTTATTRSESPLLVDAEGTKYYDGLTELRIVTSDGKESTWSLPPSATGKGPATLLRTADGLLFLFNQPGRILRIRPTPDDAEPFTIEATFTRKIPSVEQPKRIWLDPAGRICMVDARRLVIFFPEGFIPPAIRDMMPLNPSEFDEP